MVAEKEKCLIRVVCTTDLGVGTRLLAGCTTGAMAVVFAQPTDVVKVRFQAQVHLSESSSVKRYSRTIDAYKTIARDEGVKGLWKGKIKWGNNIRNNDSFYMKSQELIDRSHCAQHANQP